MASLRALIQSCQLSGSRILVREKPIFTVICAIFTLLAKCSKLFAVVVEAVALRWRKVRVTQGARQVTAVLIRYCGPISPQSGT